jgi:hypothetical protein
MTTAERLANLRHCSAAAVLALFLGMFPQHGYAHGIIGKRMFVEPLFADDPNIKNELVFPRSEFLRMPDGTVRTLGFALEKQLWPYPPVSFGKRKRPRLREEGANAMIILGCDFHPGLQQVAMLDTNTGRRFEGRLTHEGDQVRRFAELPKPVRVGPAVSGVRHANDSVCIRPSFIL